ncbi:MAG: DUF885 domain-containing protein, partial [Acidobacteriota bacterium]|nr:DUF885 domain-containing protein [Acidobacteriota bacterium]
MRLVILLLSTTLSVVQAASVAAQAPALDAALAAFFAEHDAALLARSPQTKAYRGIRDANYGKLDDNSQAAEERAFRADVTALADMERRFQPAALSADSQLSYQLFQKQVERTRAAWAFRGHDYVFDQMNGVQSQLPAFMINVHRVSNKSDAEAYVSRLRGTGAVIDEAIRASARGVAKGVQPPRWVYPYVLSDARNVIAGAPFGPGPDAPLYADLKTKVAALQIPQAEKDALLKAGANALNGTLKPAYERLIAAVTAEEKTAG